jgi:hypothetical protein
MATAVLWGVSMGVIAAVTAALVIGASIGCLVGVIIGWFAYDLGCTPQRRMREDGPMASGEDGAPSIAPGGDGVSISTGYRQNIAEGSSAIEPAKRGAEHRERSGAPSHAGAGSTDSADTAEPPPRRFPPP